MGITENGSITGCGLTTGSELTTGRDKGYLRLLRYLTLAIPLLNMEVLLDPHLSRHIPPEGAGHVGMSVRGKTDIE